MGKIIINTLLIIILITGISFSTVSAPESNSSEIIRTKADEVYSFSGMPDVLPGTDQLSMEGDLSSQMLDGAHRFIENKIAASIGGRAIYWNRDFSSTKAYEASVEPNRKRFMGYLGVPDKNQPLNSYKKALEDKYPPVIMEKYSANDDPVIIAETSKYRIFQVRWPVLNHINGEGLLIQPKTDIVANIVALPDADQTPEQLAGLAPGIPESSQFARILAENGYQVLVPVLINRSLIFPGTAQQQTYRERIYRQAFHMGRHIIGFEVQKVISAIDWFKQSETKNLKTGVAGYGEGGLIAFYTAAIDKRVDATLVSGYFNTRQKVWDEPIYRNVWALLTEFGDAEIASLIAPRTLVIEYSLFPEIIDDIEKYRNNPSTVSGSPFTGYKGRLFTPAYEEVKNEFDRIEELTKHGFQESYLINGKDRNPLDFGSKEALQKFCKSLDGDLPLSPSNEIPVDKRKNPDPYQRQINQVKEMEDQCSGF